MHTVCLFPGCGKIHVHRASFVASVCAGMRMPAHALLCVKVGCCENACMQVCTSRVECRCRAAFAISTG